MTLRYAIFDRSKWWKFTLVMFIMVLVVVDDQVDATLAKKKSKKEKKTSKPPGVALDNKNFPTRCQLCRLMVEEIGVILKGDGGEDLSKEQIIKKKRRDRRKSKKEKQRERAMPMLTAIEDVCDRMLDYVPQVRKKNFRYMKKNDLSSTQVIMTSQVEGNDAGDAIQSKFDDFRHPETNRLMSQCDEIVNKFENDLLKWQQNEDSLDLFDFLCRERVFTPADDDSCLTEDSAKSELWRKTFDVVLEHRPDLRDANFDI